MPTLFTQTFSTPEILMAGCCLFLSKGKSHDSFDDPWTKLTQVSANYEVNVVQEKPDGYIYETPHFRYISDVKLGKSLIKSMSE